MSRSLRERVLAPLRGSIRGQLLAVLVAMIFAGALIMSLVFYIQARSVALAQIRESYRSLGTMVAGLSRYDMQFNKTGLKDTVDSMEKSDPNLLWVAFVDEKDVTLASGGPLKNAPFSGLTKMAGKMSLTTIATAKGNALLIRVPIEVSVAPSASAGDIGFEAPAQPSAGEQTKPIGELRLVAGLAPLASLRQGYLAFGSLVVLLGLLAGTLIAVVVTRYFTAPIYGLTDFARQIAGGNLTGYRGSLDRKDELGRLIGSFHEMSANLAQIVREIRSAFHRVEDGMETMRRHLGTTLDNTREQQGASVKVADQVESIQSAVSEIAHLMESLSELAEEVSSSVLEMIASIDEIAANTEGLNDTVNTVASTLTQNVAANKQIDASAEKLNRFVEDTSAAMTEMEGSIRQIGQNAAQTKEATELVAEEAGAGSRAMEKSNETIEKLRASFESTVSVMKLLGKRSGEVGNILSVIDEVMEQTHLLALNAAIIAAQAGEHGKPFAVVAGEIKDLAAKTSVSTREISAIIDSVQRDVQQAVESVDGQRALVEDSVGVSHEAAKVFSRIEEAVSPSLQMVQEIARATAEQAKGAAGIVRSTEQLRDLAHQLRQATKEQTLGSEQILDAVNRIRSLSEEMQRATAEQSAGSSLIRQAMDRLTAAISDVLAQNQAQSSAGKTVEQVMQTFAEKNRANVESIKQTSEQVEALSGRAEEVSRVLSRFHIEDN